MLVAIPDVVKVGEDEVFMLDKMCPICKTSLLVKDGEGGYQCIPCNQMFDCKKNTMKPKTKGVIKR